MRPSLNLFASRASSADSSMSFYTSDGDNDSFVFRDNDNNDSRNTPASVSRSNKKANTNDISSFNMKIAKDERQHCMSSALDEEDIDNPNAQNDDGRFSSNSNDEVGVMPIMLFRFFFHIIMIVATISFAVALRVYLRSEEEDAFIRKV